MCYVCVVFFVLLNLFVAVVNEAYVLGKQEQKQIEDDLQEEYTHRTNAQGFNAYRRSKRPVLQRAVIQKINLVLHLCCRKSIELDEEENAQTAAHDDDISVADKRSMILEKLQGILLNDGFNDDVIETFLNRLPLSASREDDEDDDQSDEDAALFKLSEDRIMRILSDEFKIFNNQYEKLAGEWRIAAMNSRETALANTVDVEQASVMQEHIDTLGERVNNLETLIPNALQNIVDLYGNQTA